MRKKLKKNPKFFWSPVSRLVPKNVKEGPLGVFQHPFFCKIETKMKWDPLETLRKIAKKVSQCRKNLHKNFWSWAGLEPMTSAWSN